MPTKDTETINAAVYIDGKRAGELREVSLEGSEGKKKSNNDLISREQTMRVVSEIMADILVSAFAGKETHFDELCQRLQKRLQSLPAAYIEGTGNQATESGRAGNRKAYSFDKERYFGAYDTEKKPWMKHTWKLHTYRSTIQNTFQILFTLEPANFLNLHCPTQAGILSKQL